MERNEVGRKAWEDEGEEEKEGETEVIGTDLGREIMKGDVRKEETRERMDGGREEGREWERREGETYSKI